MEQKKELSNKNKIAMFFIRCWQPFKSAKILYSNLKYLSNNNIQDLEIKNQKIPISFENIKLVGVLGGKSSDNSK